MFPDLAHSRRPYTAAWERRHRHLATVDAHHLMLSGHVHGGQIRLPVVGSVFVSSRYGRRYDCGAFDEPPTLLHVSRGPGGKQPVRYNCRPKVTKLILRPAPEAPG